MEATRKLLAALALTASLVVAPASANRCADGAPQPVSSDPVRELHHQDSAFSLLIVAFRELQTQLIENDHNVRLAGAASIRNATDRQHVVTLAAEERSLRLAKLKGQLDNMVAAYGYSRQISDRESGVSVPVNIDARNASERLKDFVVVAHDSVQAPRFASTAAASVQPQSGLAVGTAPPMTLLAASSILEARTRFLDPQFWYVPEAALVVGAVATAALLLCIGMRKLVRRTSGRLTSFDRHLVDCWHRWIRTLHHGARPVLWLLTPLLWTQAALGVQVEPASSFVTLLNRSATNNPTLVGPVCSLINREASRLRALGVAGPTLMLISYRDREGAVDDVVVQFLSAEPREGFDGKKTDARLQRRLGDELSDSAMALFRLLYGRGVYLGDPEEVRRRQRAYELALDGDVTLLREQTVEPLHVVIILPCAAPFLPRSLSSRVESIVIEAELNFKEWRGRTRFLTADEDTAQQVGLVLATWREIGQSMARDRSERTWAALAPDSLQQLNVGTGQAEAFASAAVPTQTLLKLVAHVFLIVSPDTGSQSYIENGIRQQANH